MELFLTIICVVAAVLLVNWGHRFLMKLMGVDMMLYSMKGKLWAYAICAVSFMYLLGMF